MEQPRAPLLLENHDELENRLRFEFPDEELVIYGSTLEGGGQVVAAGGSCMVAAPPRADPRRPGWSAEARAS